MATYTGCMSSKVPPARSAAIHVFGGVFFTFSMVTTGVFAASDAAEALVNTGKRLVAEAKCEACHVSKLGGDGSAMYSRPDRRVTSKSGLLAQVARCNNELSLGLFPDDEAAIAAYLNAAHYKLQK